MALNRCIKNLLKLICLLQDNSNNNCPTNDGCTKPFLGPTANCICYNTRVVTLYNKRGTLFTASYLDDSGNIQTSSLFRVEKVDGDCTTLLILSEEDNNYLSTNKYITVNIGCICAIKCIEDVVVSNI